MKILILIFALCSTAQSWARGEPDPEDTRSPGLVYKIMRWAMGLEFDGMNLNIDDVLMRSADIKVKNCRVSNESAKFGFVPKESGDELTQCLWRLFWRQVMYATEPSHIEASIALPANWPAPRERDAKIRWQGFDSAFSKDLIEDMKAIEHDEGELADKGKKARIQAGIERVYRQLLHHQLQITFDQPVQLTQATGQTSVRAIIVDRINLVLRPLAPDESIERMAREYVQSLKDGYLYSWRQATEALQYPYCDQYPGCPPRARVQKPKSWREIIPPLRLAPNYESINWFLGGTVSLFNSQESETTPWYVNFKLSFEGVFEFDAHLPKVRTP